MRSKKALRISIITVVYNREKVISRCLDSLNSQTYKNVQHIIIDGRSTDKTLSIIKAKAKTGSIVISERDTGVYDALNKGLDLADGDIVGVLHSDDIFYSERTLAQIVEMHEKHPYVDGTYGDVFFKKAIGDSKVIRINKSKPLNLKNITYGMFPGHSSVFLKMNKKIRDVRYNKNFKIGGDFEYMVRLLVERKVDLLNMNQPISVMEIGGLSTNGISSYITLSKEMIDALRMNKVLTSKIKIYFRAFKKITQYLNTK